MVKFQATRTGDYPTLGFRADTANAILNGALSTPPLTIPPDSTWSVYGGGSAETGITRYVAPSATPIVPAPEVSAGWLLAYDDTLNTFVPTAPGDISSSTGWENAFVATVSPIAYGAAGDDTADDRSALNTALTAAAAFGAPVDLRGLTYKVTDTLTVPAGTVLRNGFIRCTGTGKTIINVTGNDVTIDGVSIIGRHATATASNSEFGIVAYGASAASPMTGLTIQNCSVELVGKNAIDLKWVTGFRIVNNDLGDLGYSGIAVLSGINGEISGNRIENVLASPTFSSNGYGIIMSRNPSSNLTTDPRSQNIRVFGNHVQGIPWEGIDTHGGADLTIHQNHVYGCTVGIAIGSCPNGLGDYTYAPLNIDVSGNIVDSLVNDGSFSTGILFTGAPGAASTDPAVEYGTGKIAGNIVRRHGDQSNNLQGAIMFRSTSALVVADNMVDQPAPYGIVGYYDNRNYVVTGNTITDAWSTSVNSAGSVATRGENNKGLVTGNAARTTGVKVATYLNVMGINASTSTGNAMTTGVNDWSVTTTQVNGTATMKFPSGTSADPGIAFAEDADCGFYRIAANQVGLAVNALGQLNFIDGAVLFLKNNYVFSCANGLQLGSATTHKLGFFGTTPIARPSAFTQTYSTASKTHDALTSTAAAGATPTKAEFDALRNDLINVKQVLNAVIDDDQALGIKG